MQKKKKLATIVLGWVIELWLILLLAEIVGHGPTGERPSMDAFSKQQLFYIEETYIDLSSCEREEIRESRNNSTFQHFSRLVLTCFS